MAFFRMGRFDQGFCVLDRAIISHMIALCIARIRLVGQQHLLPLA